MNRRRFLGALAAASLPALSKRPNIVLIMADDLGFSDIGCYGGEIRTPHLDSLAAGGIRFTQFYNCARCCPTRASLMTGLYPHQAGVGHMVDNPRPYPGYAGDLSANAVTIAEVLKTAGYRTAMAGKWHVTPVTDSRRNWPRQRGFDRFYGTIHGAGSFYDPATLVSDNELVKPDRADYYYTDAIAERAAAFITEGAASGSPFFLYVAFTAPHWPLHAPESEVAKYKGRYALGWDRLRSERYRRMTAMGLIDRRWSLTPRDSTVPAWEQAPHRAWMERRMEVYAAQVDRMDQGIGRILASLRESGVDKDTLVLFLADNGGCAEELNPRPGSRPRHIPEKTRDGRNVRAGNDPAITPGADDTYQSYGVGWANASNTPFRLYKHWVHEGGIASPLIAHWPAGITGRRRNSFSHQPGHLIDIMATCVDLAGARYPESFQGHRITPTEGKSLAPVFQGKKRTPHEAICWEHEGNRAIRQGDWKLVSRYPGGWELFDLKADRTELRDLAAAHPERVREMAARWDSWAARVGVVDWDKITRKT